MIVLNEINDEVTTKALFSLLLSETCRISDPTKSFNLVMDAFKMKPDITKVIFKDHLQDFIYDQDCLNKQKEIKNCTVCGGEGSEYYNAHCFKMINYTGEFLPSKLYLKCNDCGNLFSKYFPLKYFNRKNPI